MPVQLLDEKLISRLNGFEVENHLEIFDTQLKGFFVDVLASGRLVYRVRYRVQGRQRVSTIGDARLWTLEEARTAARGILRIALQGGDPKLEGHNGAGQGGLTVQAFFSQHYLPYVQTYKRSWGTDHSVLNNQIFPAIGHIGLAQLAAGDITQLILGMRCKGYAEGTVNRVLVCKPPANPS